MTGTQITVAKALELVRNSETGEVHPGVDATLEKAVVQLWSRIQASPDRYIMNKDEFAVFNYFQERYKGDPTARQAVARFWNNFKGKAPRVAVTKPVDSDFGHDCSESTRGCPLHPHGLSQSISLVSQAHSVQQVDDDRPYEFSDMGPVPQSRTASIFRQVSMHPDIAT
ncbi:hypothetical protein MMC17_002127 [Xylographa soralifera]|nr:hypothetical protein [Xylographa soralifera]